MVTVPVAIHTGRPDVSVPAATVGSPAAPPDPTYKQGFKDGLEQGMWDEKIRLAAGGSTGWVDVHERLPEWGVDAYSDSYSATVAVLYEGEK